MVAIVVLATGFTMAALTGTSTIQTMVRNLNMSDQESLVDEDLSEIRHLSEDYTWCAGEGTLKQTGSSCASDRAMTTNYYFPNSEPKSDDAYMPPQDTTAIINFTDACNRNTLAEQLVSKIGSKTLTVTNSNGAEVATIKRTVSLAYPNPSPDNEFGIGAQNHVLRISYRREPASQNDPVERDVLLLPTVSAWCP